MKKMYEDDDELPIETSFHMNISNISNNTGDVSMMNNSVSLMDD